MEYDIERVDRWEAPVEDGAPLLCMPNVVKPLHHLAPRVIMGEARWRLVRTKCYMDADYVCQACGRQLGAGKCHAHELYSTDYKNHISTFERFVCLCDLCHTGFIHSGRAYTLYKAGDPKYRADYLTKVAKRCFQLISEYNRIHPYSQLRVYGTLVGWAEDPELGKWIQPMVEQYHIKFYSPTDAGEDEESWGKWRLVYNDKLYEPLYKDAKEWQEAMERN